MRSVWGVPSGANILLPSLILRSSLQVFNLRASANSLGFDSFELYERSGGHNKTDKEYSIRLAISEGAHSRSGFIHALESITTDRTILHEAMCWTLLLTRVTH